MVKKRVLGKGIDAIISNKTAEEIEGNIVEVDIEDIYPNPFQPRKNFSQEKIKELANSLKESGLIQPVVVYKKENKYYLIVGERRLRAAQYLKWKTIPIIIREYTNDEIAVNALIENIQREDLNAIEIAEGIDFLIKKLKLNHENVADKMGMNRSTATNFLRLLKLPEAIKQGIISGDIFQGHARALLSLKTEDDQLSVFYEIIKNKLSVRKTELLVNGFYKENELIKNKKDPDVLKIQEKLEKIFSTQVLLNYSKKGDRGKIIINFNDLKEFDRIYDIFLGNNK
jgi:ParB family chromosome partitioning protein